MRADTRDYLKAAGIGVLAGMRSMTAPALASDYLRRADPAFLQGCCLPALASARAGGILTTLAALEMAADKTPVVPDRISPVALAGRAASGALAGALVCAANGRRAEAGALLGGLGAVAAAFASYHLRRRLGERLPVPDPVLGVLEDAIVLGTGRALLRESRSA